MRVLAFSASATRRKVCHSTAIGFCPGVECLESRDLLSAIDLINDYFLLHAVEPGLLIGKDGILEKPYVYADVDAAPLLVAAGAATGGISALVAVSVARTAKFGGFIAVDALDLSGVTDDAADGYVTVHVGYWGGFGASLSKLELFSAKLMRVPLEHGNPNCDQPFNHTDVGLSGFVAGEISSDVVGFGITATQQLFQIEVHLERLIQNIGRLGVARGLISSLLHDIRLGDFRNVDTDCRPLQESPEPLPHIPATGDVFFIYVGVEAAENAFRVTARKSGNLIINVTGLDGNLNADLRLYDAAWKELPVNKSSGHGGNPRLTYAAARVGETYYLQVVGAPVQSAVVEVEDGATPPNDPADNSAPPRVFHDSAGGDFAEARFVAVDGSNKGDDVGRISPADDRDFYRFVAQATATVDIDVIPSGNLETVVTLYDGTKDDNNDGQADGVDSDASDNDGTSHFRYDVQANGTYFVEIESLGENSTGEYEFHVRLAETSINGQPTELPEEGPLPGWGGVRGVHINLDSNGNGSSSGGIDDPGDVRWFQIDGTNQGFMQIVVDGVNDDLTEFVTAFRSNGGGIDTDSGESNDRQANVCFEVATGERIIAAASSGAARSTGSFTIDITQPPQCPDDDHADFGEPARNIAGSISDGGNGFAFGRIEEPNDNDWFEIPVRGTGYLTIEVVAPDSPLIPFLELNRDGTSGGFFETDAGYDGRAHVTFLPSQDTAQGQMWAKISSLDGTRGQYTLNVWRGINKNDDHPDSGGVFAAPRPLPAGGSLTIAGTMEHPRDKDAFRVLLDQPGPVAIQVISLTEGFKPFLTDRWQVTPSQSDSETDAGSGRGDRTIHLIPSTMAAPHNWLNIDISAVGRRPYGDYLLHVWQPGSSSDADVDTVGIEASPILLDGTGNGSLPGSPNGRQPSPALDHAGDKDVFQVIATSSRPITFRVAGQDTFLRVYNASGQAITTDHNSGAAGESEITLEANRGDLFYLEISAFNGTDTGPYSVQVSQPTDDHPDAPIFEPRDSQTRDGTVINLDGAGVGQATGEIEAALVGDRDVFQVYVAERGQLTVDVVTTDDLLDTFLRVYDTSGNLVAIDDDGADGRNSQVTFPTFMKETYLIEVSGYGDNSIGNYQVTVQQSGPPLVEMIGTFDTFPPGLEASKWSLTYTGADGNANLGIFSGQVRLEADGRGAPDNSTATTMTSRAYVKEYVSFDMAGEFGGSHNWGYAQITDGASHWIRVQMNRDLPDGSNVIAVSASGYTELENLAPHDTTALNYAENTIYNFRIENQDGEIQVYMDDARLARYAGSIAPESFLEGRSRSRAGSDRYAYLSWDNVAGHFNLSDSLPFQIPGTSTITSGTYDDFDDQSLDQAKWATAISGAARAEELGGTLRLIAQGPGATTDDNQATLESLAIIQGDTEFDLTPRLGLDNNSSFIEVTNGIEFIRLAMDSDGASGIIMSVQSNGYTELENLGPEPVTEGTTYHFAVTQSADGVDIIRDGTRIARFAGSLRLNSALRSGVASNTSEGTQQLQLYDDFNDNNFDTDLWQATLGTGPGSGGNRIDERNGRLEISGGGGTNGVAGVQSTHSDFNGAKFRFFPLTSGDVGETRFSYEAEMNGGGLIIQIAFKIRANISTITVNHVTMATISGSDHTWEIKPAGSNVEIYADGVLRHTVFNHSFNNRSYVRFGSSPPTSATQTVAVDNVEFYTIGPLEETDRFAEVVLDNVQGTFQVATDAVPESYDDFNDNQIDFDKWHVTGSTNEKNKQLHFPLYVSGQPVTSFASTAGFANGMNLRGFRLGANRSTEPKLITGWDTSAYLELTNGRDYLRLGWTLRRNTFQFETSGAYAPPQCLPGRAVPGSSATTCEIPVPTDEIPDGPLEIRELGNTIEVLHNRNVKVVIPGTIKAGSWFQVVTNGDPEGNGVTLSGIDLYEVVIDGLEFYVDAAAPDLRAVPSLKKESDTGASDADHVTRQSSVDFEWTRGSPRTKYQWRAGELLDDGSIDYGSWSPVQTTTTTQVDDLLDGTHVLSARPINANGIVGPESSRGVVVDGEAPTVVEKTPDGITINEPTATIDVSLSEPIYGIDASDILLLGEGADTAIIDEPVEIGSTTWRFPVSGLTDGTVNVSLALNSGDITDLSGNDLASSTWNFGVAIPPRVIAVQVNDGDAQRSGITFVKLQFDRAVVIDGSTTLSLYNESTQSAIDLSDVAMSGNGSAELTWSFATSALADGSSTAADGDYLATLSTSGVRSLATGQAMEVSFQFQFHRLLGDANGDRRVSNGDVFVVINHFNDQDGSPYDPGDLNGDGRRSNADFFTWINSYSNELTDLNGAVEAKQGTDVCRVLNLVDESFHSDPHAIENLLNELQPGDANLDGLFNSSDLLLVFQNGEYEDGMRGNSTWSEGDWNCSGEFDSNDLIVAFQSGNYATNAAGVMPADDGGPFAPNISSISASVLANTSTPVAVGRILWSSATNGKERSSNYSKPLPLYVAERDVALSLADADVRLAKIGPDEVVDDLVRSLMLDDALDQSLNFVQVKTSLLLGRVGNQSRINRH